MRATAAGVLPAVVSIASTVIRHDQAFSDEGLPFRDVWDVPPAAIMGRVRRDCLVGRAIITNNHVVADAVDVK